jgi:hypothetical protein
MRGYKALLDELTLHNSIQIEEMLAKKTLFEKLIQSLCILDN